MSFRLKHLVIIIGVLWSCVSYAEKPVVFAVVVIPPNVQINPQTSYCEGQTINVVRAIMASYPLPVEILCYPPTRFFNEFAKGNVDFTINIKTNPNLAGVVDFIEPSFRRLRLNLYSRVSPVDDSSIATIADFDYGGIRDQLTQKNFEILNLPSASSLVQAFLRGQTDNIILYEGQMDYFINKGIIDANSIQFKELNALQTHFAIHKRSPHYASLYQYLNAQAAKLSSPYFVENQ